MGLSDFPSLGKLRLIITTNFSCKFYYLTLNVIIFSLVRQWHNLSYINDWCWTDCFITAGQIIQSRIKKRLRHNNMSLKIWNCISQVTDSSTSKWSSNVKNILLEKYVGISNEDNNYKYDLVKFDMRRKILKNIESHICTVNF